MSATSLSAATIVVGPSTSSSARDNFSSANLGSESNRKAAIVSNSNGNKRRMIDITDESELEDNEEREEETLPSIFGGAEPFDQQVAPLMSGSSQNEQIRSRFSAQILRANPIRSSSGPKPQLKSISNIVQNSKTSNASNRLASKPSLATTTTTTTTGPANSIANLTNDDRTNNQIFLKGSSTSLNFASTRSRDLVIFPRSKSSIITNQIGACSTKPLVINHASSVEKTCSKNDISMNNALSTTDLLLSSFITAQTKSAVNFAQITTSPASSTSSPSAADACFDGSAKTIAQNEIVKSDIKLLNTTRQALSRNKQTVVNEHGSAASNGPQAVSARLMDLGKKLLEASKQGHTDIVRQLVVNSGAPFTSDWLGTTALHLAAQNGHFEIAEILLRGGVNRDARTKLDRTALHLAAQVGSLEVVDLLLIHGSDVNASDMLKMSPLHWAVERGHVCVVEKLLVSGADVQAKSKFQLTPIDIALNSDSYEMVELFKVSIKISTSRVSMV